MEDNTHPPPLIRFGSYELDTRTGELRNGDRTIRLHQQPLQLLLLLLERPLQLVSREELRTALWPDQTYVDFEDGLNHGICRLREALGDSAENPRFIETLPRRGYRFVGAIAAKEADWVPGAESSVALQGVNAAEGTPKFEVSTEEASTSVSSLPKKVAHHKRLPMRTLLVLFVGSLIAIVALLFRFARRTPDRLVVTETRQLTYMGDAEGRIQTDGRRIYFNSLGKAPLRYVSVNGGEATDIPSPVARAVQILHMSPDGSYLLINEAIGPNGGLDSPLWLVEVNSGAARRLGGIEAHDAAFAPDGKTIVIAKGRVLYSTDMQGVSPVKLVEAPGQVFKPRWSPDGQRLRFHVWDGTNQNWSLWELGREGTLRQLFIGWKKASYVCCPEWTADGRFFLFKGDGKFWWVSERPGSTTSEPTLLTTIGNSVISAVPSPLSNTIYVNVEQGSTGVFKWDLKQIHTPTIVYPELNAVRIEFSRNGYWIAYSHKTPKGYELWRARADGTQKLQLTTSFDWIFMVRYSPDGTKIALMAIQPNGAYKIYWVSPDGGALHEIPSPITVQADPAWSPNGQFMMFGSPPENLGGGSPDVVRHLYLYDLRTKKSTEVPGSDGLFSPRWSPDGRYVAAMSADLQSVWLLDTTTSKWRLLTRRQRINYPFWSPDSAWVYFNDVPDKGLCRVRLTDNRQENVGTIPTPTGYNLCTAVAFSPEKTVLLQCSHSRTDIFALDYKEQN